MESRFLASNTFESPRRYPRACLLVSSSHVEASAVIGSCASAPPRPLRSASYAIEVPALGFHPVRAGGTWVPVFGGRSWACPGAFPGRFSGTFPFNQTKTFAGEGATPRRSYLVRGK